MARDPKKEWFWPLGSLDYAHEIHDLFEEEAAIIGAITILWNRHELALRHLFVELLAAASPDFAAAIWDRQPTHQARRDLLALAIPNTALDARLRSALEYVIEHTKTLADRRNDLIHAEYVVHGRTDVLHAKLKSPRSTNPARHQKLSVKDLRIVERDLVQLIQITEATWLETPRAKEIKQQLDAFSAQRAKPQESND